MLDLLSDILTRLSMKGSLYFRTAFTPPWGVEVPAFENVARFHYAYRGNCCVHIAETNESVMVSQGGLIIIPHGASHTLYSDSSALHLALPLDRVLEKSGFKGNGVLVYSGHHFVKDMPEQATQLICGHFSFASHVKHQLFDRLPAYLHIPHYGETAGPWMEATLRMIGHEAGGAKIGGDLIALKLSEVIFTLAIRTYIETQGADRIGFSGFADPYLVRALDAFHKAPAEVWSVERLARVAGLSRTGFAVRFAQKMALTPMEYLTHWRMQIACHGLSEQKLNVSDVAALVGYASESAFTKVFKREVGMTPTAYRLSQP